MAVIHSRLKAALEDAILSGEFAPGDRLDEGQLAARFGVSRTPIREALLQLGAEGLIELRPRRGAVVSAVSPQKLLEMFETMAELEAACGRFAARRMTPEDEAAILDAHGRCIDAAGRGDTEAYYEDNRDFHEAIYKASRNAFLSEQAHALHKRLSPYRRIQLRARQRLAQSLKEHQGIVDALSAGDGDLAATRLREHVVIQGERFTDIVLALSSAA